MGKWGACIIAAELTEGDTMDTTLSLQFPPFSFPPFSSLKPLIN